MNDLIFFPEQDTGAFESLIKVICNALDDKKGMNIVVIDVSKHSSTTAFFIFAEGSVNVHVKALACAVVHAMNNSGISVIHKEGSRPGEWIVIDYGFIIVHILIPSIRELYRIENMWQQGVLVDIEPMLIENNMIEKRSY